MTTTYTNVHAERFRRMAETVAEQTEALMRPRLDNTPKRARQAMQARLDAQNSARVAYALRALANGHEAGTLPPELAAIRTRAAIEPMVSKCTESRGYYHVCEGKDYRDNSPTAAALRAWLASVKSSEQQKQEAETAAALKLAELDRSVKFADIPGFFPTPADLIARMMDEADCAPGMTALEPSAGKGDILAALQAAGCNAVGFEINHTLANICKEKGLRCECTDFLSVDPWPGIQRIVMNPPFEQRQDAKHVRRAYDWLGRDGRIVAIVGNGCMFTDRCQWFRDWLTEVGAIVKPLPEGSFKNAFNPTGVNVTMLVIDKR